MSKLLEIFGRAITVDTADLIWHWLDAVRPREQEADWPQYQQLNNVIELIADGKTDTAEEQLRLHLFDNPSCIRGRMAAAAICLAKNQLQNAIEELNSVYMRQPNNTMALYVLGHCLERLGKESEAVEFYQDCLKFKNYLQLPRQRLAAIYFKNRQLEKAIQEYELLKNEYPDDVLTLVILGHLYVANAQYEPAVETFNTAILIHPDNFDADGEDIEQLIAEGQLDEALEQLEHLLEEHPDRPDLALRRADILNMLGMDTEAVLQYQEALRINPDFLEATIKLGTQYLQMQQERLAAQQFNRAAEVNDEIVDAYIGLTIAQKLAGKVSDALATLSLAAAIQPNSPLLLAETAALQFKVSFGESFEHGDDDESNELMSAVIQSHQQQLRRRPQNPDLHYRLGILMMSAGWMGEAIKAFQGALEINPTYSRARSKLAVCLFEAGQKEQGLEQLIGPDCLNKDTLELHYKTALLYCDRVKFASSLLNLDRFMESNFACTDSAVNVSIVLQNLGLLDRATAMWDNLSDTANQARNAHYLF
jgi:tetratricopeptide (TPR) repeat protein